MGILCSITFRIKEMASKETKAKLAISTTVIRPFQNVSKASDAFCFII